MAKEISNEIISYDDYYFDGNKNMLIPVSTVVLAEDVLFADNTNLADKIESLKAYGTDVKAKAASAVSKISTFTSSDAAWDEIISNLANASKYLAYTDVFDYTGSVQTYTVPITGTYQIECMGAQGNNGAKGASVVGIIELQGGDILNIYVGGQNGYNGGGEGITKSTTGSVSKFSHSCNNANDPNNRTSSTSITSYAYAYNGGGATDIRLNGTSLNNRIIVAGGGSGGSKTNNAVSAGNTSEKSNSVLGNGNNGSATLGSIVQNYGTYGCSSGCVYNGVPMGGYVSGGSAIGGGGGGYYGGAAGYAGTSYANSNFSNVTKNTGVQSGNGYMKLTLL